MQMETKLIFTGFKKTLDTLPEKKQTALAYLSTYNYLRVVNSVLLQTIYRVLLQDIFPKRLNAQADMRIWLSSIKPKIKVMCKHIKGDSSPIIFCFEDKVIFTKYKFLLLNKLLNIYVFLKF